VLVEGVTVSTLVPVGVTEDGLSEQVAPLGQVAPTLNATDELNPPDDVRLMVEVFEAPCRTEIGVGLAEMEKSAALTVTVNVVVWVSPAFTLSDPLTVTT
jgi:hypothetical protein